MSDDRFNKGGMSLARAKRESEPLVQGVTRTFKALAILGKSPEGLTISQIAVELDTNRQVVYRLVSALQSAGFVLRGDDGKVRLGIAVLDLARQVYPVLRIVATPVLRDLSEKTGATAHLTIVSNEEAYALAVEAPTSADLHLSYRVGAIHSLDRGAAGRAILEWRKLLSSTELAESDKGLLAVHPPWVSSEGELQAGAFGVAAAVGGVDGLEASIGVVSLAVLDTQLIGPLVINAAEKLASLLSR